MNRCQRACIRECVCVLCVCVWKLLWETKNLNRPQHCYANDVAWHANATASTSSTWSTPSPAALTAPASTCPAPQCPPSTPPSFRSLLASLTSHRCREQISLLFPPPAYCIYTYYAIHSMSTFPHPFPHLPTPSSACSLQWPAEAFVNTGSSGSNWPQSTVASDGSVVPSLWFNRLSMHMHSIYCGYLCLSIYIKLEIKS